MLIQLASALRTLEREPPHAITKALAEWQGSQTRKVCDDFTYCGATMANLNLEPMISMRNGID